MTEILLFTRLPKVSDRSCLGIVIERLDNGRYIVSYLDLDWHCNSYHPSMANPGARKDMTSYDKYDEAMLAVYERINQHASETLDYLRNSWHQFSISRQFRGSNNQNSLELPLFRDSLIDKV